MNQSFSSAKKLDGGTDIASGHFKRAIISLSPILVTSTFMQPVCSVTMHCFESIASLNTRRPILESTHKSLPLPDRSTRAREEGRAGAVRASCVNPPVAGLTLPFFGGCKSAPPQTQPGSCPQSIRRYWKLMASHEWPQPG